MRGKITPCTCGNRKTADFVAEGVKLAIGRSKTDQEATGQIVGVVATGTPTYPVAALRTWQEAAGITEGAVFGGSN